MTAPNISIVGMKRETGFGRVTMMVYRALRAAYPTARITVYESSELVGGMSTAVRGNMTHLETNVFVSVMDWQTTAGIVEQLRGTGIRTVAYAPLDTDTIHGDYLRTPRPDLTIPSTDFSARLYREGGHRVTDTVRYDYVRYPERSTRYAMRDMLGIPADAVVYIVVNDYTWRKNTEQVIDAYRRLSARNTHLIVVSRGIPDSRMLIASDGRKDITWFNNDISNDLLWSLYMTSDIYVSASAGEGFGWTAWDAGHLGLRLVVPDHTAFSELFRDYPLVRYMGLWERYIPFESAFAYYRPYSTDEIVSSMYLAYCDERRNRAHGHVDYHVYRGNIVREWIDVSGRWLHIPFQSAFNSAFNLVWEEVIR